MLYYANGLFKAKSTNLLKKNQFETLLSVNDERFFELLRTYGFGINTSIDELYANEIYKLKKDLVDSLNDLKELKVFFYPFDILNTKLIYKQVKENIDTDEFYIDNGNIDPNKIYQALKYQSYQDLYDDEELFVEINKITETDYHKINYKIEKKFIETMLKTAKSSKPVRDYLNLKLDITNILTIIRIKELGLNKDVLKYTLHETENLTEDILLSLYDKSFNEIERYVNNIGYFSVARSIDKYIKEKDLENLEGNLEYNLYELLINYSYESEGLGYIMSYVYFKLMELKNISIIYYNRTTSLDKLFIVE